MTKTPTTGSTPTQDDAAFEHYLFLRLYFIDFDQARATLREMRSAAPPTRREVSLRDAIVAYCRPFSGNFGANAKHRLHADAFVPQGMRPLHDELVAIRDRMLAHTDLAHHESNVTHFGDGYCVSFKSPDYHSLLLRTDEIESLVASLAERVLNDARACHEEPWFRTRLSPYLRLGSVDLAGKGPGTYIMPAGAHVIQ